jgi:peptidoglycan/LPS O-acetylase OafA/YrhL
MLMTTREEYYPTLDGWRAVAIAGVTTAHAAFAVFRPGGPHPNDLAFAATRYGALGVDLFFGISGFLICSRLVREFEDTGALDLRRFYIRRAFRILPPYLFTLLAVSIIAAVGLIPLSPQEFWTSLLFVRNYVPAPTEQSGWYTAHFWSLSTEEHFYLLWPLLLVLWTPARAVRYVVFLACGVALWRAVEFRMALLSGVLPAVPFYTRTDIRIDALLWGCFVALLLRDPLRRARCRQLLTPATWVVAVALYVACVATALPFAMAWEAMLVPVILVGTVLRPEMAIARLLETRVFRWIGRLSYSLYLWQTPFFTPSSAMAPLGPLQSFPLNVIGVVGLAVLSYYAIERPMIRVGRRLTTRREEQPVAATLAGVSQAGAF